MEFIDGCKIINAPTFFDDWDYARDVPALHAALAPWPCCVGLPAAWAQRSRKTDDPFEETWHAMQLFLTGPEKVAKIPRVSIRLFACLVSFAGRELCKCYWRVRWIVLPDAMHRCLLSALHASLLLRFLPESGCSLASILLDAGCFHGDPHPGNVLVRRRADAVPAGQSPFQAAGRMQ